NGSRDIEPNRALANHARRRTRESRARPSARRYGIGTEIKMGISMEPVREHLQNLTRRHFLLGASSGVGSAALGSLLFPYLQSAHGGESERIPGLPNFAPTAKRVICLFQSGGVSHVDLFDDKPALHEYAG